MEKKINLTVSEVPLYKFIYSKFCKKPAIDKLYIFYLKSHQFTKILEFMTFSFPELTVG